MPSTKSPNRLRDEPLYPSGSILCLTAAAHTLRQQYRAFSPHVRAKKLARAAECLVYALTPSGVPWVFGRGSRSQPAALVSDRDDAALFPAIRILERYGS